MNINQMRDALKRAYPSKQWAEKVTKMRDDQIQAIYLRFKREGKIR